MARRPSSETDISYSEQESQRRFEAALRASRNVGHMPMKGKKQAKRKRILRKKSVR
jgi:hypothetical protein